MLIADGRAGVFDEDLRAVAAHEDGVVLQADGLVGAGDAGDGVFERLAGGLVEDGEDEVEGLLAGLGFGPAGQLLRGVVDAEDAAFGVAGDHAVADGLEGGAKLFFRSEGLFGADAQDVVRLTEGAGDLLDQRAEVEADNQAERNGGDEERDDGGTDLLVPLLDRAVAIAFGDGVESFDAAADVVHEDFAVVVEGDIVGMAASLDGADEDGGEGLFPGIVGAANAVEEDGAGGNGDEGAPLGEGDGEGFLGVEVVLEQAGVVGDLVAAQAALFIDGNLLDGEGVLDAAVHGLDLLDGRVGGLDLPGEDTSSGEQSNDRHDDDLAEDVVET